jgi:hypothetical protein
LEDWSGINAGIPDDHTGDVIKRIIYCAVVCSFGGIMRIWGDNLGMNIIANSLFTFGCYFLIFDYALNLLRGLPIEYLGENAEIDKILSNYHPMTVLIYKFTAFIVGLAAFIWL